MTPQQYCQDKAATHGTNLYYSVLFLSAAKRDAVIALHAFCRELHEVVTECSDAEVARTTLHWWRAQVLDAYEGKAQHPVMQALVPVLKQYHLPQEYFLEIIDGVGMDVDQARYNDFKSLQLYCYRVSSVPSLLCAEILGYRDRQTLKFIDDLGIALQLTNMIRDVGEYARRNQIYLPVEDLEQFNVPASDILQARDSESFQQLMAFQLQRARGFYDKALQQLAAGDRKLQCSHLIMATLQRAMLDEIEASGCRVLQERVSLTPLRKLWLAYKTWLKN